MGIGLSERETDMAVQLMKAFGDNPVFELGVYGKLEMGRKPFAQFKVGDNFYRLTYNPRKENFRGTSYRTT